MIAETQQILKCNYSKKFPYLVPPCLGISARTVAAWADVSVV